MADVVEYLPVTSAYVSSSHDKWPTTLVQITEVEAPRRDAGVVGLNEERTISVLKPFRDNIELPPLEVHEPPQRGKFRYRVQDGYHRYYLSVAVGFTKLPISVRPFFDFYAL